MNRRTFTKLGIAGVLSAHTSFAGFAQFNEALSTRQKGMRRVGRRLTGTYWGLGGERIDLMSGNLNFAVQQIEAGARGLRATAALSYNSQWSHYLDGKTETLAGDVGFGHGWTLQFGSIVPVSDGSSPTGYIYRNSNGAEYRLSRRGNTWISTNDHFITWNPATSELRFLSGSRWIFKCVSGAREADAGTLYPTRIHDTNGNLIEVAYLPGMGESSVNTSARMSSITDARALGQERERKSYLFVYNSDPLPHLIQIVSRVSAENSVFSYAKQIIRNPLLLQSSDVVTPITTLVSAGSIGFSTNEFGELVSVQVANERLDWQYRTFSTPSENRVREVCRRELSSPHCGSQEVVFERSISNRFDGVPSEVTVRSLTTQSEVRYTFFSNQALPEMGMLATVEDFSTGGKSLRRVEHEWSTTLNGALYVKSTDTILDPGDQAEASHRTEFLRDEFGCLVQRSSFDYSGTLLQSVSTQYLRDPGYIAKHILNRVVSSTVSNGYETAVVLQNQFDTTAAASCDSVTSHDSSIAADGIRGNVSETYRRGVYHRITRDTTGLAVKYEDTTGGTRSIVAADGFQNTRIGMVIPNGNESLAVQFQYSHNSIRTTRPNGATSEVELDASGRITRSQDADGGTVLYSHGELPTSISRSKDGRTKAVLRDAFGHKLQIQSGDSAGVKQSSEYRYGAVGCLPHPRLLDHSLPHAPGENTKSRVTYDYDELGRLISKTTNGTSSCTMKYAGNTVVATDSSGSKRAMRLASDHRILEILLPDKFGALTAKTVYDYNVQRQLTSVKMPSGKAIQSRTFAYDSGGRIMMRQHAEGNRQARSYNADGTLASIIDGKGQRVVYTRDDYKRVVAIDRYAPDGRALPAQRTEYLFDQNTIDPEFSENALGRLAVVRYGDDAVLPGLVTEMYSYTPAGKISKKRMRVNRGGHHVDLDTSYTYNQNGKIEAQTYPVGGPNLSFEYDSMHRLNAIKDASGPIISDVSYTQKGHLQTMRRIIGENAYLREDRFYTGDKRLSRILVTRISDSSKAVDVRYTYGTGLSSKKLVREEDIVSGNATSYKYDQRGRIDAADGASYSATYQYDEWGNRLSQKIVGRGSNPDQSEALASYDIEHDPKTNWMLGEDVSYDANGNLVSLPAMQLVYDVDNRLVSVSVSTGGREHYAYDSTNRRIWRQAADGREVIYSYDAKGRLLGSYDLVVEEDGALLLMQKELNVYFQNRLVATGNDAVISGRAGKIPAAISADGKVRKFEYTPFGEDVAGTSLSDRIGFGGYVKDESTGLLYAEQRYYSSKLGRFITPDPLDASAHLSKPDTWNRYTYVSNDPVNYRDEHGLQCSTPITYFVPDDNSSGSSPGDPGALDQGGVQAVLGSLNDPSAEPSTYTYDTGGLMDNAGLLENLVSIDTSSAAAYAANIGQTNVSDLPSILSQAVDQAIENLNAGTDIWGSAQFDADIATVEEGEKALIKFSRSITKQHDAGYCG